MLRWLRKLMTDARGGTAIEYGLILSLVVLGLMAALINFAHTSVDVWDNVAAKVRNAS